VLIIRVKFLYPLARVRPSQTTTDRQTTKTMHVPYHKLDRYLSTVG